jgi:hypothetical protein
MIEHPRAIEGYDADFAAMEKADTFVMVLPCGKSAHLELGWAIGAGKRTAILLEDPVEPELMYRGPTTSPRRCSTCSAGWGSRTDGELSAFDLSPTDVKELLALFKGRAPGEEDVGDTVRLDVDFEHFTITDTGGLFEGKQLVLPRQPQGQVFPDIPMLVSRCLGKRRTRTTRIAVGGVQVGLFSIAARVYARPLTVEPTGESSTVVIACGESFLGLLMPMRVEKDYAVQLDDWRSAWLRRLPEPDDTPAAQVWSLDAVSVGLPPVRGRRGREAVGDGGRGWPPGRGDASSGRRADRGVPVRVVVDAAAQAPGRLREGRRPHGRARAHRRGRAVGRLEGPRRPGHLGRPRPGARRGGERPVTVIRYAARADWPHPVTAAEQRRSRWTFKASHADTIEKLRYELEVMGADQGLVEVAVRPQDILRDGAGLRANSPQPAQPGVSLTIRSETGVRVFATDVCETWQHNLRSIALGLEALRAVSRYGITPRGEQYAGFLAIESGRPTVMTVEQAAEYVVASAGVGLRRPVLERAIADPEYRKQLYRQAAQQTHPDRGGDPETFTRLGEAMDVLNAGAPR